MRRSRLCRPTAAVSINAADGNAIPSTSDMAADRDTNPTTGLSAASRPEADGRSPGVERVQSVERSFAILSKLHGKPQTLTQLVDSVELAKSTVNRLLATLVAVGAVVLDRVSGLYSIGPLITAMGQAPRVSLTRVAEPILRQLASTIGESVGLGVRDFFEVLYVADIDADTEIQLRTWVGERVPMHAVPSGIVLLAAMDAARSWMPTSCGPACTNSPCMAWRGARANFPRTSIRWPRRSPTAMAPPSLRCTPTGLPTVFQATREMYMRLWCHRQLP